jgi:hypothetical protein
MLQMRTTILTRVAIRNRRFRSSAIFKKFRHPGVENPQATSATDQFAGIAWQKAVSLLSRLSMRPPE